MKKLAASTPDSAVPVVEPPSKKAKINTSDTVLVKKVILNLFDKSKTDIVRVNVNQQVVNKDCGLFAIAIATSLLFGDNVKKIKYRQHEMRSHFHSCFVVKKLTPFPSF